MSGEHRHSRRELIEQERAELRAKIAGRMIQATSQGLGQEPHRFGRSLT
jgi:hypothetical protein